MGVEGVGEVRSRNRRRSAFRDSGSFALRINGPIVRDRNKRPAELYLSGPGMARGIVRCTFQPNAAGVHVYGWIGNGLERTTQGWSTLPTGIAGRVRVWGWDGGLWLRIFRLFAAAPLAVNEFGRCKEYVHHRIRGTKKNEVKTGDLRGD